MLSKLLTSDTRAEVMRILFDGRGGEHYLREIEKLTHIKINSLQKEVKHLESIDLIKARKDGNRIYYSANKVHPLYPDLISIVEKTVGVVSILKEKLKGSKVKYAFIFGSVARNEEMGASDLDLIVVGDLTMRTLTKLISGTQEKIGREINPHVYSENEFKKRLKMKDHFLTSVLKNQVKQIVGDVDEYK
jgi:predicted nucleotidyltransferase